MKAANTRVVAPPGRHLYAAPERPKPDPLAEVGFDWTGAVIWLCVFLVAFGFWTGVGFLIGTLA